MSSIVDQPVHRRDRDPDFALPPIGLWWPMLEGTLRREVLENLEAPLRAVVVRRIFELCELDTGHAPRIGVYLDENQRAYIAGWMHRVDWT